MKVLITGAFGNLGLMCIEQALALGFEVRCTDLASPHSEKLARQYQSRCDIHLLDICQQAHHPLLLEGIDAVIHNASLLPPATETQAELAEKINVTASKALIDSAADINPQLVFVFPSSVTVFGLEHSVDHIKSADDAVQASDNYTRHKITIERYLAQTKLNWVVVRIGVSVDTRTLATDRATFRNLLNVSANNPLEYVHPKDVALAMCQACQQVEAIGKILLLGGGKDCQINQREFLKTAFDALGLNLPVDIHGQGVFYTHWMDTNASQAILNFQQHSFADYQLEMQKKLKPLRYICRPLAWLINPILSQLLRRL